LDEEIQEIRRMAAALAVKVKSTYAESLQLTA
jgi:hypothetical protein